MIGWIQGLIVDRPEVGKLVLDVHGVGYDVEVSLSNYFQLETKQDVINLYIHTVVREDAFLLYGFMHKEERSLFRSLIKVNGIGPKLAMNILSSTSPLEFIQWVHAQAADQLVRLPGIGKKTAERILVEMKDKLQPIDVSLNATPMQSTAHGSQEAISALEALGYQPREAAKMVKSVEQEGMSCEQLIREALKNVHLKL